MRLIDADILPHTQVVERRRDFRNGRTSMRRVVTQAVRVGDLEKAQTVDAVPVVRCKDCDNRECEGREGLIVCGIDGTSHPKDWFCADGERRSGDE